MAIRDQQKIKNGAGFLQRYARAFVLWGCLMVAVGTTAWPFSQPVSAAVEMKEPFAAQVASNFVKLTWTTASEYNVSQFQLLFKEFNAPESDYLDLIRFTAKGAINTEAAYEHTLSQQLAPGRTYCFRLKEVTTDNEPGDIFDLCGYGLGITPTDYIVPTFTPIMKEPFAARTEGSALKLTWTTASEEGIGRFQIYGKDFDQPDSAYSYLQEFSAQGGADSGAPYEYTISQGLLQGQAYCFRLLGVTADGQAASHFDLCGYGINISPATLTPMPNSPLPTPVIIKSVPPPVQIPEPITIVLFGTGLVALSASVSKRCKN